MGNKVLVMDYGMGNISSVIKKLKRVNADPIVSSNYKSIIDADKIILPGVGHFGKAMNNLVSLDLLEALNEAVLIKKKPILGICLGMQLMTNKSEEGDVNGLGWFDAEVVRFNVADTLKYKVPHTGWNQILQKKESVLMKESPTNAEFYFVHSYHLKVYESQDVLNQTDYEYIFPSAIEKENIFGVQYHPEKSHDVGEQIFKNFISL